MARKHFGPGPSQRIIEGRPWIQHNQLHLFRKKRDAQAAAKRLRRRGLLARVVRGGRILGSGRKGWDVYIRRR